MALLLPWLTENVRGAAERCGALSASVFVPTRWNPAVPGVLVHVGSADPLPELASMEAAVALAEQAVTRLEPADGSSGGHPAVLASEVLEGCLIPIPLLTGPWTQARMTAPCGEEADGRSRRLSDRPGARPPVVGWLGLRFAEPSHVTLRAGGWQSVLELASALASTYVCSYGILTDPVIGLPGRAELNGTLRAELDRAHLTSRPFSLLFVKLENLDDVNGRLGRRAGDAVLREFLDVVHTSTRNSDVVMRYGGTVFALPLRDTPSSGAVLLGEKLRRRVADHRFLDAALQLPCAVGVASWEPMEGAAPLQALELVRRTDQALLAACQGKCSRAVSWQPDLNTSSAEHHDPLMGVFTGQAEKDYRNMRLLWDVLQALSSTTGLDTAEAVVARMFSLFAATRAALFQPAVGSGLRLTAGQQRLAGFGTVRGLSAEDIGPDEWRLNEEVLASLSPSHRQLAVSAWTGPAQPTGFAVPLVIDGRALGTLYLLGGADVLKVDETDLPVLERVAAHLALSLDREQLAQQQRQRDQQEQQQLRAELDRLRTVLNHSRFVFRSKKMSDLLDTTRRVAATDVTVLITGESGTGKEMLAHTVHELSGRRDKPLVIVDCGAIPVSLIDSELFGRERGAYTGAERRAAGRLAQADGGTVFLDEIGELPLEVQSRLLRFVQEKTITMVGGTRSQRVDVRIIAATNRDLEHEVRAGRFRDDLFHRLNVVRLRIPSLRERPDDVPFLARHFLQTFARDCGKSVRGLEPDAEQLLQQSEWPGNVRELQNTILQAVVLTGSDLLTSSDLNMPGDGRLPANHPGQTQGATVASLPEPRPGEARGPDFDVAWRTLTERLATEVAAVVASGAKVVYPLGKWLARDVVLVAHEQAGAVAARAAACLGLPETTFSRRLRQAQADAATTRCPESWTAVRFALADLLRATGRPAANLADRIDDVLLGIVVDRVPHSLPQAAALVGVSVPTMKRHISQLRQREEPLNVYA